ncbi:hypothetical protein [Salibacterium sp. K-3]
MFQVFTNEWIFVMMAALLYWTVDKPAGGKLLIVLALSIYFHGLVKHMFLPLPDGENGGFTFPSKEVQLAVSFWGYLIPEMSDRRFTLFSFGIILFTVMMTVLYTPHTYEDILMGGLLGMFIVYAVYRSMDWINSMPEPYLFSFSLVLPSSFLLLFPDGAPYAGLLLGSGAGYSVERLKCRMVVTSVMYKKIAVIVIGSAGLFLIASAQVLLPSASVLLFLHAAGAGLWITLILPAISVRLGLNQQSRTFHTF